MTFKHGWSVQLSLVKCPDRAQIYCNATKQTGIITMSNQQTFDQVPVPTEAFLAEALANARRERAQAVGVAFGGLGRAIRRLWSHSDSLEASAATR